VPPRFLAAAGEPARGICPPRPRVGGRSLPQRAPVPSPCSRRTDLACAVRVVEGRSPEGRSPLRPTFVCAQGWIWGRDWSGRCLSCQPLRMKRRQSWLGPTSLPRRLSSKHHAGVLRARPWGGRCLRLPSLHFPEENRSHGPCSGWRSSCDELIAALAASSVQPANVAAGLGSHMNIDVPVLDEDLLDSVRAHPLLLYQRPSSYPTRRARRQAPRWRSSASHARARPGRRHRGARATALLQAIGPRQAGCGRRWPLRSQRMSLFVGTATAAVPARRDRN